MEKDENSIVRSLRAPQDTFEKLKEIAADNKMGSQGEALTALIRLWELNQAKVAVPDRATEIDAFRSYLNKAEEAFIHALEVNISAEDRIKEHYEGRMKASDATIAALQEAKANAMEENALMKEKVEALNDRLLETEENFEAVIKDKKTMAANFARQLADKDKQIEDKEKLNTALAEKAAADKARITELEDELLAGEDYQKTIDNLQQELVDARKQIANLQKDVSGLQQQLKFDVQAARLEAQQEAQERIAKMQDSIADRFSKFDFSKVDFKE